MNTHRSIFRSTLAKPLLAAVTAALLACTATARADTLHMLQVEASTTDGGSHFAFNFPLTNSDIPLARSASYISPVGPHTGCCSGSYAVDGVASDAHGGTVMASASGSDDFAGSTAPYDPLAGQVFGQALSYAVVTTYFQLVGPASSTPIGVDLAWEISASSTGAGSAYADLDVYGGTGNGADVFHQNLTSVFASGIEGGDEGALSVIGLLPNTPYRMTSTARAAGSSTFFGAPFDQGSGSAFVDPLFSLPDAYQTQYHFVGLPTAAAVTPVPEPSVMLLLTAGLAAVRFKSRAMNRRARST